MATSPGRSAIQARPAAMTAIEIRKRMIRIIPASLPAKRVRSIVRKLARRCEGNLPRSRLGDPGLRGRPRCGVELAEINERIVDGCTRCFLFDARQHGGSIVTHWRIDRANAHKLGCTCLETLEIAASRRLRPGSLHQGWNQRLQLTRKRRNGRYAACREWCERRQRFLVRTEGLNFIKLPGE